MTGDEKIIEIKNLSRIYAMGEVKVRALNNVTLDIKRGEFAAIMGKSGSGKSTLLHQLGLLDAPTSGEIVFGGKNISDISESEKARFRLLKFGYVFQEYALLPELTALENVYLPAMALGRKKEEYLKAGTQVLEQVGISEQADKLPALLSGGQQQRAAIARALANDPPLLLADEPTGNLDSHTSEAILQLFKSLAASGKTIVMVTHERDITTWVSSVVKLADGKVANGSGLYD